MSQESQLRTDIQALRAIAVAGVIAYHVPLAFVGGGYLGVDVFFVVSGFLITDLMLRSSERNNGRLSLVDFYDRRARRILPAASLVILATMIGVVLRENALQQLNVARDAIATTFFVANVHLVQTNGVLDARSSFFGHFWSLSVEEQFYMFWPLIVLGVGIAAGARRRVALAIVVAVVAVGSLAQDLVWRANADGFSFDAARAFFLLPSRVWQLALGALLAICAPWLTRATRAARHVFLTGGFGVIVVLLLCTKAPQPFPAFVPGLIATLATVAVVASGLSGPVEGPVGRLLATRPFQVTGRYSYSLYLWHIPVTYLLVAPLGLSWKRNAVLVVAISAALSIACYHLVENPVRHSAVLRARPGRSLAFGAGLIAVVVACAGVVSTRAEGRLSTQQPAAAPTIDPSAPLVQATPFVPKNLTPPLKQDNPSTFDAPRCGQRCHPSSAKHYRADIAVVGEGHDLLPGFISAAETLDVHLTEYTQPGCTAFAPAPTAALQRSCAAFDERTRRTLVASPPDLIVLSTDAIRADETTQLAGFAQRVTSIVGSLRSISPVAVVTVPPFRGKGARTCLADNVTAAHLCDATWPTALNDALGQAVQAAGGTLIDLKPTICVNDTCPAIIGNQLVWSDREHLTAGFAELLGPWLAEQLRPLLPA